MQYMNLGRLTLETSSAREGIDGGSNEPSAITYFRPIPQDSGSTVPDVKIATFVKVVR